MASEKRKETGEGGRWGRVKKKKSNEGECWGGLETCNGTQESRKYQGG